MFSLLISIAVVLLSNSCIFGEDSWPPKELSGAWRMASSTEDHANGPCRGNIFFFCEDLMVVIFHTDRDFPPQIHAYLLAKTSIENGVFTAMSNKNIGLGKGLVRFKFKHSLKDIEKLEVDADIEAPEGVDEVIQSERTDLSSTKKLLKELFAIPSLECPDRLKKKLVRVLDI